MRNKLIAIAAAAAVSAPVFADNDFGAMVEHLLKSQSLKLFGIVKPLNHSASGHVPRVPGQQAEDQVMVAKGLRASFFTRNAANLTDMIAFWPNRENPTHMFTGVENFEPFTTSDGKAQPCVQRIDLRTGQIDIVLRGLLACDGIQVTPWGTLVVAEETDDGALYEILDPVNVTDATVTDRATGASTDPQHVAKRPQLGSKAWEGMVVLPSGVVYSGDELRPGDRRDETDTRIPDADGGAIYKFVPTAFHDGAVIESLDESPLAAGALYALQVSCREASSSQFPQFGQGCEVGDAAWVRIEDPENARAEAHSKGATGYYRPEDIDLDPVYDGVRFCVANTQREKAHSYGEVLCAVDHNPEAHNEIVDDRTGYAYLAQGSDFAVTTITRFIEGNPELNSVDNLAFQPHTGNLYVVEDHKNGDVWGCLRDGEDEDLRSDGCVRVLSVKEENAEPTGFIFNAEGTKAWVSIQHTNDDAMPQFNGVTTDDLIEISGFRVRHDR